LPSAAVAIAAARRFLELSLGRPLRTHQTGLWRGRGWRLCLCRGLYLRLLIVSVSTLRIPSTSASATHQAMPEGVAVAGNYAYVADYLGTVCGSSQFRTPRIPSEVGYYDTPRIANDVAVVWELCLRSGCRLRFCGHLSFGPRASRRSRLLRYTRYCLWRGRVWGLAYVADGYAGLRVISVSDPAHPVEVGHYGHTSLDLWRSRGWGLCLCCGLGVLVCGFSQSQTPRNPVEVGCCDTTDRAENVRRGWELRLCRGRGFPVLRVHFNLRPRAIPV